MSLKYDKRLKQYYMITKLVRFHKPDEENGYLSNWYPSEFSLDGKQYCCAEQYIMEQKALMFCDIPMAEKIISTDDPDVMQKLGRNVSDFSDKEWDGRKQIILYKALIAKFSQNGFLREKLLREGPVTFVECSHSDHIWGIGRGMDDDISDVHSWNGQNLLGFALGEVQAELKSIK